MRNKIFVLFFLCLTVQPLLFAQSDSAGIDSNGLIKSILANNSGDRAAQMEKLFKTVPSDKTERKVVSFQDDFRNKYLNDKDFNYDQEAGSKTFLARFLESLGNLLKKLFGFGSLGKVSDITSLIFKIICGLIVLVVIYFIIRLFMNHKGKWFFQKKNEAVSIDINDAEQLIQSADFEQLICEVEKQGNTRQSIRLYYLWLLKDLKEKELIIWLPEKTNADYMAELKNGALRERFSYLSYLYNYIWYGEFSITGDDYLGAKKAFLIYLRKDGQNG